MIIYLYIVGYGTKKRISNVESNTTVHAVKERTDILDD